MRRQLFDVLAGLLCLSGSALAAPVTAIIPGGGGFQNHFWNFDSTLGYEFSLTTTLDVSALGFFDADNDGLFDAHDVGIFAGDGTLLASATVPSAAGGTLQDGFRFMPIPDLVLLPGTYRIGAQGSGTSLDEFLLGAGQPEITRVAKLAARAIGDEARLPSDRDDGDVGAARRGD